MKKEEFVYIFKGEKIKGPPIPYSFLKGAITNIAQIVNKIKDLDEGYSKDVDFNVEIKKGSVAIHTSAMESDPIGLKALKTASKVIGTFMSEKEEDIYSSDAYIRRKLKDLVESTYQLADTLEVSIDDKIIGKEIGLNESTLKILGPEEVVETFVYHIAFVHKINVKNSTVGLTIPALDVFSPRASTIFLNEIIDKKLVKKYIWVKLDMGKPADRQSVLIDYKELPSEITKVPNDLQPILKEKVQKITEVSKYKSRWDGYNASPISDKIIKTAHKLLNYICVFIDNLNLKRILPNVVPVSEGTLQFEWQVGRKYLEIEIISDTIFNILHMYQGEDGIQEEKEFTVSGYEETLDSILWLLRDK